MPKKLAENAKFEKKIVSRDEAIKIFQEKKEEFKGRTGLKTVPQIYGPDNEHIGGYDDLKEYLKNRMELLNSALK